MMRWEWTPYALSLFSGAIIAATVAMVAFNRRWTIAARPLTWLSSAVALWCFASGMEAASIRLEDKIFWSQIQYVGIVSTPLLLLNFALSYAQWSHRVHLGHWLVLIPIPAASLGLALTNSAHGLIWNQYVPSPIVDSNVIIYGRGAWFWVNVTYAYVLLTLSAAVLIRAALEMRHIHRQQAMALLMALVAPWLASILYDFGVWGRPGENYTPIGFAFSGLLLLWSIYGLKLMDLAPVARHSLIEGMADAMFVLDGQNRMVDLNPAARQLMHLDAAAIGRPAQELFAGWPDLVDQTWQAGAGRTEIRLPADPGIVYEIRTSSLTDRRGKQTGRLFVLHDISDLKRAEREMRQAKESADAANQAKSDFLASMSHEIRTPMNAIIGMTSLLYNTALTAEQREFAETIRLSSDTLLLLVSDILDLSKIEAGRIDLEDEPFDLRSCVEDALSLVAGRAAAKNVELAYLAGSEIPFELCGDVTRLRQILINLLSNAVKFTERGEVVVTISTWAAPNPGDQKTGVNGEQRTGKPEAVADAQEPVLEDGAICLHFAVRDTGIGIPPDQVANLFDAFRQAQASTTRRYGGTGLGLAISKRLCELMGGAIWAESPNLDGEGATFHFTALFRTSVPAARSATLASDDTSGLPVGRRVLIVDGHAATRQGLVLLMEQWGTKPHPVADLAAARAWLQHHPSCAAIVVDWELFAAAAALSGVFGDSQSRPPVIALAGLAESTPATCDEVDAFVRKPVRYRMLLRALVEATRQTRTANDFGMKVGHRGPVGPRSLRILLAEDNLVNQRVAQLVLERIGYQIDVVGNGIEALAALRQRHYDIVLMDVVMPDMDGLQATSHIRAEWPPESRPYVIAMTANATEEDRNRCLAAGMDAFVSKPIQPATLARILYACERDHSHLRPTRAAALPEVATLP